MFYERGRYFADWMDKDSIRRRRAFKTGSDATAYENTMRNIALVERASETIAELVDRVFNGNADVIRKANATIAKQTQQVKANAEL